MRSRIKCYNHFSCPGDVQLGLYCVARRKTCEALFTVLSCDGILWTQFEKKLFRRENNYERSKQRKHEENQVAFSESAGCNEQYSVLSLEQTGKVCELVVSKFQIAEELTEANYLEKLEARVAMWNREYLKEVFIAGQIEIWWKE